MMADIQLISTEVTPGDPFHLIGVHLQELGIPLLQDLPILFQGEAILGWEVKVNATVSYGLASVMSYLNRNAAL